MRAFLVLTLLASTARASTYVDRPTGMSVPLELPGAKVCVFKPEHLYDVEECAGVDVEEARGRLTPRIDMAALVRWDRWSAVLSISSVPRPAAASFDAQAMRQLLSKANEASRNTGGPGNSRGLTPGASMDTSSVGSLSVVRFITDVKPGPGSPVGAPDRLLTYGVGAPGALFVVTFATLERFVPQLVPAADAFVHGMQIPARPPKPDTAQESAAPPPPQGAPAASAPGASDAGIPATLWLVVLGAGAVIVVLVFGARRERREQRRRRAERSGGTVEPR
jgi:hypothetical protein